mgnify:CR=1 FL=1
MSPRAEMNSGMKIVQKGQHTDTPIRLINFQMGGGATGALGSPTTRYIMACCIVAGIYILRIASN